MFFKYFDRLFPKQNVEKQIVSILCYLDIFMKICKTEKENNSNPWAYHWGTSGTYLVLGDVLSPSTCSSPCKPQ